MRNSSRRSGVERSNSCSPSREGRPASLRRPAPLAVVASELTLGATAYEGRREASAGWLGGLALSKAIIYVRRGLVIGTKTSSVKKTPLASVLLAASWRGLAGAGSAHARHLHNHSTTQRASCACSTIRAADPEAEQHRCSCGLRFKIQEARSALSNTSRRDGDLHNNQALGGRNEQGL